MRRAVTVTRHRTLWISDVHLGSPGCKAARLTAFLKSNQCEQLYLVGDIVDGWKLRTKFYWPPAHSEVVRRILVMARRGTKVDYLAGNHDGFLRQFVRTHLRLGRIRFGREAVHVTAHGQRLLVTHGDRFDAVVNQFPRLAFAADYIYERLVDLSERVDHVRHRLGLPEKSLSARAKNKVKSVVQYLSGFDEAVLHECRRHDYQGVVCGHTHNAEVRYLRGGVSSYNCGDWVESCTALAEGFDGQMRVVTDRAPAASSRKPEPIAVVQPPRKPPLRAPTHLPPALRVPSVAAGAIKVPLALLSASLLRARGGDLRSDS